MDSYLPVMNHDIPLWLTPHFANTLWKAVLQVQTGWYVSSSFWNLILYEP